MKALEDIGGWGNIHTAQDSLVYRPERFDLVKNIICELDVPYIAIGNLRGYGDAAINGNGAHIQMKRLNRILDFDAKTGYLTAEAGTTIKNITDFSIAKRFLPPVVPDCGLATLGGCLATDIQGRNHPLMGSFSDHVICFDLLMADGNIRTITPHDNTEIFSATAGGMGLTGIILTVTLQLTKVASASLKVRRQRKHHLSSLIDALKNFEDDYTYIWIDTMASGKNLGRGVLKTAHLVSIEVPYQSDPMRVPFMMPSFIINNFSVKWLNNFYFNRAEMCDRETFEDFRDFSFSQDKILHANRLYGKNGFYHFKCYLPSKEIEYNLRKILKSMHSSKRFAYFMVLKKLKSGGRGLLSQTQQGYCLSMDFPNIKGMLIFLKSLEAMILDMGGYIYLANDTISSENSLKESYKNAQKFIDILNDIDPKHNIMSDAAKRLGLKNEKH